jgi:hypothetical protein
MSFRWKVVRTESATRSRPADRSRMGRPGALSLRLQRPTPGVAQHALYGVAFGAVSRGRP